MQLTGSDKGWPVAQETTGDPLTTALVVQSLLKYTSLDSSLSTNIASGLSSLGTNVTSASPVHLQALAALTYLREGSTTSKSQAAILLTNLASAQSSSGTWSNGDPYATAVAARAMAAAMGTDVQNLNTPVNVPDPDLRAAINYAMGRNGMDAITQGDMLNLVSLTASGYGISDLTGLQYATNLSYIDVQNNNISSFAPLSGLTLTTELTSGNPGSQAPSIPPEPPGEGIQGEPVPAMSLPVSLFTVLLLMGVIAFMWRRRDTYVRIQSERAADIGDPLSPDRTCGTLFRACLVGRRPRRRLTTAFGCGDPSEDSGDGSGSACGKGERAFRPRNQRAEKEGRGTEGRLNIRSEPLAAVRQDAANSLYAKATRQAPLHLSSRTGRSGNNRRTPRCAPPWRRCGRRERSCSKERLKARQRSTWP